MIAIAPEMRVCFGAGVRSIRQSSNLSQKQLALRSGLSRGCINGIETGRHDPTLTTLYKLMAGLDTSFEFLFKPIDG